MKIGTAAELREADRRAIDELKIPGSCLMQSAGEALARACVAELGGSLRGKKVALLCGKGNNGGDGLAAARHLLNAGAELALFLAASPSDLTPDTALHFAPLQALGVVPQPLDTALAGAHLVVDCLLGTGAKGAPVGLVLEAIQAANKSGAPILSCDIPSGVSADTGLVAGLAIQASATVTLAALKPGLLLYPGAEHCGRVTVADIGLPQVLQKGWKQELVEADAVRALLPVRRQGRDANKGAFGTVLVVAGARGMAGAAVLTATAALRAGAGLVYLAVPESLAAVVAAMAPEVVIRPMPESADGSHGGEGSVDRLAALAEKVDVLAIGPGLGTAASVTPFVESLLAKIRTPLVIDADGLNAIASKAALLRSYTDRPTVLTPHPGEMGRLLGIPTAEVQADRLAAAKRGALLYGAVTLLKGAQTLVTVPDGRIFYNRLGSVALSTAGSGDVLTGTIAALLASGLTALEATTTGAYLHALAGELAERELGAVGVLASEIRDHLPAARRAVLEERSIDE